MTGTPPRRGTGFFVAFGDGKSRQPHEFDVEYICAKMILLWQT